jgi:hypothetical protein
MMMMNHGWHCLSPCRLTNFRSRKKHIAKRQAEKHDIVRCLGPKCDKCDTMESKFVQFGVNSRAFGNPRLAWIYQF